MVLKDEKGEIITLFYNDIIKLIPHRHPFLLIDKITDIIINKSITGVKAVTFNEPFFSGHFPHQCVMPGVLIVEAMAQASALVALRKYEVKHSQKNTFYFVGIEKVRFKRPVVPGDSLVITSKILRTLRGIWKFSARAEVEEQVVTEAQLMCTMKES